MKTFIIEQVGDNCEIYPTDSPAEFIVKNDFETIGIKVESYVGWKAIGQAAKAVEILTNCSVLSVTRV